MNTGERDGSYPESERETGVLRDAPDPQARIEPDEPSAEQIAIYRAMTPQRRLEIANQMYWSAREWKAAGVRWAHPDWSEEQVAQEVTRIFANARS